MRTKAISLRPGFRGEIPFDIFPERSAVELSVRTHAMPWATAHPTRLRRGKAKRLAQRVSAGLASLFQPSPSGAAALILRIGSGAAFGTTRLGQGVVEIESQSDGEKEGTDGISPQAEIKSNYRDLAELGRGTHRPQRSVVKKVASELAFEGFSGALPL